MTADRIVTGSLGWTHADWDNDYYPEDLPEDWRLDYYSHHFQFILMQINEWLHVSPSDIEQWLDDVNDAFEFFLAIQPEAIDNAAIKQIATIKAGLGKRLRGLVILNAEKRLPGSVVESLSALTTVYLDTDLLTDMPADVKPCWRHERAVSDCVIGFIQPKIAKDMRAMRAQIESFLLQCQAQRLYLVYEGQAPSTKAMQDAQVIIQLLT